MKIRFQWIIPFALLLVLAMPASGKDLFTGTLEVREGKPMLVRCDLVKNTYLLVDAAGNSEVYLKQLTALGVSKETPFQATVIGDARMEGDAVILTVDSIEDIKGGSCHAW